MHRLLVSSEQLAEERPNLSAEARHHLKVVRPKEGECIELFDGCGAWRLYAWRGGTLAPEQALCRAEKRAYELTLFACVTKGSRWDWTIEKATELGVTRMVPVLSDRTIVRIAPAERAAKCARWRRIAEDAARQSDAKWLPEISEAVDFRDVLAEVRRTRCFVGALTQPPPPSFASALQKVPLTCSGCSAGEAHARDAAGSFLAQPLAVFVGPEGDFTPQELASLLEIAQPVSFGTTILRAETAAIYGVSVVKASLDFYVEGCDV